MSKIKKIFGGGEKPKPLPPIPTREDPSIAEARAKQLSADKFRRGRSSSILTSNSGIEEDAFLTRPGARSAKLLGK